MGVGYAAFVFEEDGGFVKHSPILSHHYSSSKHGKRYAPYGIPKHMVEDSVSIAKKAAGVAACDFVTSGMKVGLGTGSTVRFTVIELARRMKEDGLRISGIPTSKETQELALSLGIPLLEWSEVDSLDVTIDGSDEFDPNFQLIKGGGGALTREKIVANVSNAMVVVTDPSKDVATLGAFPLPVEIIEFGWEVTAEHLSRLCPGDVIRRGGEQPFVTDNGNFIIDCHFGSTIDDPCDLEMRIRGIPGVVEVGLFNDMADAVVIGSSSGVEVRMKPEGRLT